jgi:hypothetical protein
VSGLRTIFASVLVVAAAQCMGQLVGCASSLSDAKGPEDECAARARAEYYVGHMTPDEAMAAYDACMREHGR